MQQTSMEEKVISIRAFDYPPKRFVIASNTPPERLDKLIRREFMLSQNCDYELKEHTNKSQVAIEHLIHGNHPIMQEFEIAISESPAHVLHCEPHYVVLKEPIKIISPSIGTKGNAHLLYNPLSADEQITPMCATMYVNMPTRVQLRRHPDPDRMCYMLDLEVAAQFGIVQPAHMSVYGMWCGSSFRLKMREIADTRVCPPLLPYACSPKNQAIEVPCLTRELPMRGEPQPAKRVVNCAYNPFAHRFGEVPIPVLENPSVVVPSEKSEKAEKNDPMEKMDKEKKARKEEMMKDKEFVWNSKSRMVTRTATKGYKEWYLEPKVYKDAMPEMEQTFKQSFMFEWKNMMADSDPAQYMHAVHYEFELVGEMTALYNTDPQSVGLDEVHEVVQHQPYAINPGRKRIAAVQVVNLCVDVYPKQMSVVCYKKGDVPPALNSTMYGQEAAMHVMNNNIPIGKRTTADEMGILDTEAEQVLEADLHQMHLDQARNEHDNAGDMLEDPEKAKHHKGLTGKVLNALNLEKKKKGEKTHMTGSAES